MFPSLASPDPLYITTRWNLDSIFQRKMGDEDVQITELRLGPPGDVSPETKKKRLFLETFGGDTTWEEQRAEKSRVVGWPPVCSYRQRNGCDRVEKKYVKVSMDGAPFLRKVDLNGCKGYTDLSVAIHKLFDIGPSSMNYTDKDYVQIYEDREGDWMLVGDVPWKMFTESCKKLRVMKSSEAKEKIRPLIG